MFIYLFQKFNSYRGHGQFPGKRERELTMDPSLSITCVAEDLSLPSKKKRKSVPNSINNISFDARGNYSINTTTMALFLTFMWLQEKCYIWLFTTLISSNVRQSRKFQIAGRNISENWGHHSNYGYSTTSVNTPDKFRNRVRNWSFKLSDLASR